MVFIPEAAPDSAAATREKRLQMSRSWGQSAWNGKKHSRKKIKDKLNQPKQKSQIHINRNSNHCNFQKRNNIKYTPRNRPRDKLSRHNPFKPFRSLVTRNIANNHAAHYFSELPVVARVASHIVAGLLESLAKSMGTFCDRHSQKLCIAIDIHKNCALQWLQIAKSQTCLCRRVVLLSATFHMEAHSSHEIVQSVHPVARQVVPVNYRFHAPVAF